MLSSLHIENIAVVESADITFDGRLNVLTGETGAGKSIVIDALGAMLGQRTSRELIRSGCDAARVSAVVSCPGGEAEAFLAGAGFEPGEEVMIERLIYADGRNVCRVDGRPVTVSFLRDLGSRLVNIHGQHDSQALLIDERHMGFLDAFAGLGTGDYRAAYEKWRALERERRELQMDDDEKNRRVDMLSYRIDEIERAAPVPGETDELSARRKVLRNAEKILSALEEAYRALYGGEDSQGACDLAARASDAMEGVARHGEEFASAAARLSELSAGLSDCADDIRSAIENMECEPGELERIEGRLDLLSRLTRKYGLAADELLPQAEAWRRELEAIESGCARLAGLDALCEAALGEVMAEGAALTALRAAAAKNLEERMVEELESLDMRKVHFCAELKAAPPNPSGCDSARFLISTNPGEPVKPLSKIASGGEMARIMLALKNLLAEGDEASTLVFDEVDSGVSGRAAQRVAQKLCDVSRRKQVLCVTHLPQIAAMADTHFRIEKGVIGGRTVTTVDRLDYAGRAAEIARITGGAEITDTTLRSAAELMAQAESYKKGD